MFCGKEFFLVAPPKDLFRSTMGQARLNHIAVVASHKEVTDDLDLEELVDSWRIGITAREYAVAGISRKKIRFGQASLELEPSS